MIRRLDVLLTATILASMSSYAAAQGHGPGAQGVPGGAGLGTSRGPVFSSPAGLGQSAAQSRRQDEQHRLEAQQRRAEGEAHNRSAEARSEHAPDEHAADEARLADKNSANKDRREQRRELRGKNRGDHGRK